MNQNKHKIDAKVVIERIKHIQKTAITACNTREYHKFIEQVHSEDYRKAV